MSDCIHDPLMYEIPNRSTSGYDSRCEACTTSKEAQIYLLEKDPRFEQEDAHPQLDEDLKEPKTTLENENWSISKSTNRRSLSLGHVCMDPYRYPRYRSKHLVPSFVHIPNNLSCQPKEKKITIGEEESGFIREVKYPSWLSNVVTVKKPSDKWRIYTNYTNLNKACPKDLYPLPKINALVDEASSYDLLNFMDAYLGYNQIWMHPCDKSKTTFMIDKGDFCYRVMPFGLKNVVATYQRLMDRIFKEHIGNQLEVYEDNMVVKSKIEEGHVDSLSSIFGVLKRHQLKLNLEKFSFGIKVAEKSNPIFQYRRKAKCFKWANDCEETFQELKVMLAAPPILTQSVANKPIYVYISISDNAVSLGEQWPVYYVNKALQGVARWYQKVEKAALAIIITAKKLRPCFQSHPMICMIDLPIWKILRKLDLVLADFINELTTNSGNEEAPKESREWTLFVDDSFNKRGNGTRVILEGLGRVLIEQSLDFCFQASNNQLEDEVGKGVVGGQVDGEERLPTGYRVGQRRVLRRRPPADSILGCGLNRTVIQEALGRPTVEELAILCNEWQSSWCDPIISYPNTDMSPKDSQEARRIKRKVRVSFPLLRCLGEAEVERTIKEVHEGACRSHIGGRALASKIACMGFY
ncbi:Retrovirus-related Pol polyprotein from transposon opus, partial [Mucuna pruriens]